MAETRQCPQCGTELAADAPEGLCPKCLLIHALPTTPPSNDSGGGAGGGGPAIPPSYQGHFTAPTPDELAKHFPQLEIIELLGQGGMGAVYKARQPGLDRLVAVKILPPDAARDPTFAERFQREARALAKLNHPNIVAVYDFGQTPLESFMPLRGTRDHENCYDRDRGDVCCTIKPGSVRARPPRHVIRRP